MIVSLILAMDESGGIGKNNRLPWHLPSDLKRFKKITMGHHLVMGRKTYETIGKPLSGRIMIVVTHQKDYRPKGCLVVSSLNEAIKVAEEQNDDELFIIGGGEIFHQAIDLADKVYLTTVHADIVADVFFPKIDLDQWVLISDIEVSDDNADEFKSNFRIFTRKH